MAQPKRQAPLRTRQIPVLRRYWLKGPAIIYKSAVLKMTNRKCEEQEAGFRRKDFDYVIQELGWIS